MTTDFPPSPRRTGRARSAAARTLPAALVAAACTALLAAAPAIAQNKARPAATTATAPAAAAKPGAATAANSHAGAGSVTLARQITLSEGKSSLMQLPFDAARIAVGDARVADVILINPSEIYMLGKSTGMTNLIVWNRSNQASVIDITVGLDTSGLRQQFEQLFPNERDIHMTMSGNALILSGTVADSVRAANVVAVASAYLQRNRGSQGSSPGQSGATQADAGNAAGVGGSGTAGTATNSVAVGGAAFQAAFDPIAGLGQQNGSQGARVINMLNVAAPQQVMLEVKIAEVSKTLVDQLGASLGVAGTRGSWTYTMLSNFLSGNPGKIDAFNKNGNFLTLDAQKADGLVKILAEPTVMAISGQEASFLAGGKIFIPVSQDTTSGTARVTLEEKEFGIAVRFTPTVLEGGRINLRVAPEVSELNREGIGITAGGTSTTAVLPSFTTRRASTTVQLFDGQSFAIGGLLKNNVTTNIKAFPGLGEIPILGALFRSSDFQTDRTELVFIVTPHLAQPLPPDQKLPTDSYVAPSRAQFFLQGKLEGTPPASTAPAGSPPAAPGAAPAAATPAATPQAVPPPASALPPAAPGAPGAR